MGMRFLIKYSALILPLLFCACKKSKLQERVVAYDNDSSATDLSNQVSERSDLNPRTPTLEEQLFNLIQAEQITDALALGRTNIDSLNPMDRKAAAEAFAWIGPRAINDPEELMGDENPEVSELAADGWLSVIEDLRSEKIRCAAIVRAVPRLRARGQIEQALMSFATCDEKLAKETLGTLIRQNEGTAVAELARDMYSFVADGEVFGETASLSNSCASINIKVPTQTTQEDEK